MSNICCDTSFLFAVYGDDVHTPRALHALSRVEKLSLSSFNTFELTNAFRLAEFRGLLRLGSAADYLANLARDFASGELLLVQCDLAAVLGDSERLSALYTARNGYRSFDILHVAVALYLGASEFLSFDAQQG